MAQGWVLATAMPGFVLTKATEIIRIHKWTGQAMIARGMVTVDSENSTMWMTEYKLPPP